MFLDTEEQRGLKRRLSIFVLNAVERKKYILLRFLWKVIVSVPKLYIVEINKEGLSYKIPKLDCTSNKRIGDSLMMDIGVC